MDDNEFEQWPPIEGDPIDYGGVIIAIIFAVALYLGIFFFG